MPLICGGDTAAGGPNRGDEVGKISLTVRAWPRETLLRQVCIAFPKSGGTLFTVPL